jgi:hypothetical protein
MIKIKSKMLARKSLIGNTQPGDIVELESKLWCVINRCQGERARLVRSIVSDESGSYINKIVRNNQRCAVIFDVDIKTIEKSRIFNWVRCSIETIFKSRRFSQI